jgi:hypothetical protein
MRSPLAAVLAALFLAGCSIPQDPQGTLAGVRGDTLHVGVTEAPPFIVRHGAAEAPGGVEAALIRGFADSLDAAVAWHWGTSEAHFEALMRFELDLVAGGLTTATPWKQHAGLTRPYHTAYDALGALPETPGMSFGRQGAVLGGAAVAVPEASGLAALVEGEGFRPARMAHPERFDGLAAAPEWQLRAWGRVPLKRLRNVKHVLAVPPGENGFLFALERYLQPRRRAVEDALVREAAAP